jgi:hypothetical protein
MHRNIRFSFKSLVTGKCSCSSLFTLAAGKKYFESKDGIELCWATNHFGPFLLTMLLLGRIFISFLITSNISSGSKEQCNLCTRLVQIS